MLQMSKSRMRLYSGITAFFMVAALFAFQITHISTAYANYTVIVDPSQQYQTIQGWGTSMAWWANIIGGWSDSQRIPLADALYDPTKGIGLNIVRYNFGADGPGNVCTSQMKEGRNIPSFEPTQGNYVWTNDARQLWFAQAAKARGADVFEGFVNAPPAWMLNNSCTAGGAGGAENISTAHYSDLASYIATIAKHFHDSFGLTLQTVAPFNEPSGTWWTSTGTQEGLFVSRSTQNAILPLVATALSQNGASAYTSVSSPDDNTVAWANSDYAAYSSASKAVISQWNTHTYGGSDADRIAGYTTIGQIDHKRVWMSEWGKGAQGSQIAAALTLSREILDDEQHLHPAAWVAWQAVNEAGDTPDSMWGLAYRNSNNTLSYPSRYYAMGNYSKFVREGSLMIGNNDANSFTSYNASTHTLVLVTTNSATSNNTVTYDLSRFSSVGSTATPYQTSASANLQQLAGVGISNKVFSSTLPAQSITTFVIPNVTYTGGTAIGGGYYALANQHSNLLLDVTSASTSTGAKVIQWNSNGGTNQQWRLVPVSGGFYNIVNRNSGLLLDVTSSSTGPGASIIQWSSTGGTNQQWSLVPAGGGFYTIVNRNSGLLLDVNGASTSAGAGVIQWNNTAGSNQLWRLILL